ncbi:hypothetical protein ACYOEI_07915 [Singulisphaera rosea]
MRAISSSLLPVVLIATLGCGPNPSNLNLKPPPNGGAMVRLPRDRGYVAIKTENPSPTQGPKLKNRPVSIVAYFYRNDASTPMTPAPTDVVFKIGTTEKAKSVTLAPDAKDPNRFVSEPGPYSRGIQGMIHAKVDGEEVEESFSSL